MNPLIQLSKERLVKEPMGSGRFYARLSQSELIPAPVPGGVERLLFFEAFDRQWFDNNPPPDSPEGLAEYYEYAAMFILQARVRPSHLGMFSALEYAVKLADEDEEANSWFVFDTFPSQGQPVKENDFSVNVYANIYQPGIPAVTKEFREADKTATEQLRRVVKTDHIPDATEMEIDEALKGVAKNQIDWAIVYDVGQGNSIGLCNRVGSVEAYFDLGGGVLANARTFPASLTHFCFSNKPPIILSHWDFDHWSSANRDPKALGMTWIAPRQSVGPSHVALMTSIMATGKLLLVPATLSTKWRGQLQIEHCTGRGRNHSGLAVTLSEFPNGKGEHMLFPGDARYPCLPSFSAKKKYLSVVAPHHGADMRNRTTPACGGLGHSRLVYSFGAGNTFGHPRAITRNDHVTSGWRDPHVSPGLASYEVRETTYRLPSSLGHVLLGWKTFGTKPPLPCPGQCQLQAEQL